MDINLIEEIKDVIGSTQVQPSSKGDEYLEAVIDKKDLESISLILKKYLGVETKVPLSKSYSPEVQKTLDSIGGLRVNQSFFFKRDDGKVMFAALWPWETNPEKITVKIGVRPLLFP